MALFKDMLRDNESLFTSNVEALDFDYLPKLVPFREQEQHHIAGCIKPLFQKRNGRNLLIHGKPGIGKTAAVKHVLKELEEETDEVLTFYINCWQKNTSHKVILELCEVVGYKFTQNKKTEELAKIVQEILNKNKGAVFVFDEVDKAEDFDFMYTLLEDIYRKTIILITNYPEWISNLDERIRSRLIPEMLAFRTYTEQETIEILRQRMAYAFVPGVWEHEAFIALAKKASEIKDIRAGLHLLRQAGQNAEDGNKKKITLDDAKHAIATLSTYSSKGSDELIESEQEILEVVKKHSGKKIGELFKLYQQKNSDMSYKTFQRKIKKLEEGNYVAVQKMEGGSEGMTTLVSFAGNKTLKEFSKSQH